MNILFLTLLDLEDMKASGIYHDFVNELHNKGHHVTVVSASEKRNGGCTKLIKSNGIEVLKVRISDVTKTSFIKKGINTLRIEHFYRKAIKYYLNDRKYDLIIYTTPPITFNKIISYLKKQYNAKTYLLLKDIFPQNAVDLGLFKKINPVYQVFRQKEKKLYAISDYIGGMSQGNIDFIKNHNNITAKTQVIRNAMYEQNYSIDDGRKAAVFKEYNLNINNKLFLYGGNLGIPQGIDYIKKVMTHFHQVKDSQLLIVGNGTHYDTIKKHAEALSDENVKVIPILPKEKYDELVAACDVGLIFLDHRFTIPNYPSRMTGLLNAGKPILMATDKNTDIKDDILYHQCGLWNESIDVEPFIMNANQIIDPILYKRYAENALKFYYNDFRIEKNITQLLNIIE